uniref:Uncharacterized protein n=1 Tax=Anguilla anguilla TaxID=7936 RepID=A0A0E9RXJ6_ANGAN
MNCKILKVSKQRMRLNTDNNCF